MMQKNQAVALIIFCLSVGQAFAGDSAWYFTKNEIDAAYRYQEQFGQRLRYPIKPSGCYMGQSEIAASFQGKEFMAPCRFITETTRHLKLMLEQRAANYLFPLDVDHAHIAIPKELWVSKYSDFAPEKALPQLLREPKLMAIYHTAEHVALGGQTNSGKEGGISKEQRAKSEVWGSFDGSPIKIVAPSAHSNLENYREVSVVHFLAHRLGEMVFSVNGKAIPFDLSFDEDFAVVEP